MEKRTVLIVNDAPRMQDFAHDHVLEGPFNVQVVSDSTEKVDINQLDLQDDLPLVWGYPLQLKLILDNLIINTIDAMDSSPRKQLRIETRLENQDVVVIIPDTGQGIPAKDLSNIFSPDYTTKPIGNGTGLGLSSVKSLLAINHGEIAVQSTEGQGTTAIIRLSIDRRVIDTELTRPVSNDSIKEITATLPG